MRAFLYRVSNSRFYLYISGLIANYKECFIGLWHYLFLQWYNPKKDASTALLVEINPFHGETLPGYTDYLQRLGFQVTVIMRHAVWKASPFCRMNTPPRQFCLTIWGMRHYLASKHIKKFDFVFYNSSKLSLKEYRFYGIITDFLKIGSLPMGQYGNAIVEHNLKEKDNTICKNTFVLTPWIHQGKLMPMCNPHTFGTIQTLPHRLSEKRVFITVGKVISSQRDFKSMVKAFQSLSGGNDYELKVVGIPADPTLLSQFPENRLIILGRLSFPELYNQLEQADFFLPLLDPLSQPQYLNGCTSGSRQLILGFRIPPIIHEAFAEHYDFTKDSCLTYSSDDDFITALKRALTMTDDEHTAKRQELARLAEEVYQESLCNLAKRVRLSDIQKA